jgi:hypothetical protein
VTAPVGGGGRASAGMASNFTPPYPTGNQPAQREVAVNPEVIGASLRSAVEDFATAILRAVPHTQRSASESGFLADVKRGRRELNEATLLRLFVIASRSNQPIPALSTAFGTLEVRVAASVPVCAFEAVQAETVAQGPADQAAILAIHEDSPVRWWQLVETGRRHMAAWGRTIDAATRRALMLENRRAI